MNADAENASAVMKPRASFVRRHPWLLVGVALLLSLVGAGMVFDKWCQRILIASMRPARLAHEPLTVAEIEAMRPKVPDAENMAPTLTRCGDAIGVYESSDAFKSISALLPLVGTLPSGSIGTRLTPEQQAAVRTYLTAIEGDMAQFRKAVRSGKGSYSITWTPIPILVNLPFLSAHRQVCKSLCLEALSAAGEGRPGDASAAIRSVLQADAALVWQPHIIGALVRMASVALAARTICNVVSLGGIKEAAANSLQAQLAGIERGWSMRFAMLSERASACESLAVTYGGSSASTAIGVPGGGLPALRVVPGLSYLDQEALWRFHSQMCDATLLEPPASLKKLREAAAGASQLPSYCISARIMVPSMTRAFELWYRALAVIRATQAALACERYRLVQHRWPESLGELVPAYLDTVPLDPFDGKALRYVHDARGIRVWSIGEDGRDDGGELEGYTKLKRATDWGAFFVNPELRGR